MCRFVYTRRTYQPTEYPDSVGRRFSLQRDTVRNTDYFVARSGYFLNIRITDNPDLRIRSPIFILTLTVTFVYQDYL